MHTPHWHFTDKEGSGYICEVNPDTSHDNRAEITVMYPLDTTLKIAGDAYIVKQLIERLNGMKIEWKEANKYDS